MTSAGSKLDRRWRKTPNYLKNFFNVFVKIFGRTSYSSCQQILIDTYTWRLETQDQLTTTPPPPPSNEPTIVMWRSMTYIYYMSYGVNQSSWFKLFLLQNFIKLQIPTLKGLQGTPCKSILTGKTLFSLQGTLFSLQGSCFHYRDFLAPYKELHCSFNLWKFSLPITNLFSIRKNDSPQILRQQQ